MTMLLYGIIRSLVTDAMLTVLLYACQTGHSIGGLFKVRMMF